MPDATILRGARLHNLKNVAPSIPQNGTAVLAGLSGSVKSTLALPVLGSAGTVYPVFHGATGHRCRCWPVRCNRAPIASHGVL
jgi:hypothetical protein